MKANQEQHYLFALSPEEELLKHNLVTREFWSKKNQADADNSQSSSETPQASLDNGPFNEPWQMLRGVTLYEWQQTCVNSWLQNKNGTIKVVTGAGKTILAFAIIQALRGLDAGLRVAIVVPTMVLQNQWYEEILKLSNLPPAAVGKLGGGHNDAFDQNTRILICVLKTASAKLASVVEEAGIKDNLLLVADECHRAGSKEMSNVFSTKRAYQLGLSATPERDDWNEDLEELEREKVEYSESFLGKELGPIIYEMTLSEAFERRILPPYEINHYGLLLSDKEKSDYQQLSRAIQDLSSELKNSAGSKASRGDHDLMRWCQTVAKRGDDLGLVARQFISKTNRRKKLLYDAEMRSKAVIHILKKHFRENPATRAILFHESIESVMQLYFELLKEGMPVVAENSELPESLRENGIELFRNGTAQIIVSARSLIEGFNVPETDIGIIVASNTSVRQRIQTLGRVLRKSKDKKTACIYVLYMRDTTDEFTYGKVDWEDLLGAEQNKYYVIDESLTEVPADGPPRSPLPDEKSILPETLTPGQIYPGQYRGDEYSCDTAGNVFDRSGNLMTNAHGISLLVAKAKGSHGKFRVTPIHNYLLVLVRIDGDWETIYAGKLDKPLHSNASGDAATDFFDFEHAGPGTVIPQGVCLKEKQTVYLKQSRGILILAKKEKRGELFARIGARAVDKQKGKDAEELLKVSMHLKREFPELNKLIITECNHAVCLINSQYRYICKLTSGLEFPE